MKTILTVLSCVLAASLAAAAESARWAEPFDLKTPDGKLLRACTVRQLTPDFVQVAHQDGIAKLPLEKLDAQWQETFGFDPEKARLWREEQAEEQKRAADERKQLALEKRMEKEADQSGKIASLEKQLQEKNDEIERLRQTVSTLQQQVDAQAAALKGRPVEQNVTVVERVGVIPYKVPYPVVIQQPVGQPIPFPVPVPVRTPGTSTSTTTMRIVTPGSTGVVIPGSRPADVFKKP